jgi:hypothetical protein
MSHPEKRTTGTGDDGAREWHEDGTRELGARDLNERDLGAQRAGAETVVTHRATERDDEPVVAPEARETVIAAHRPGAGTSDVAAQHARWGGFKLGAAFFGWLSAIGLAALLTGLIAAGGTALAFNQLGDVEGAARDNASTIGIGGGIALLAILLIAYFAGGYVAGRLARFDGARQGVGVWVISLLAIAAFALAGVLFGSEYNVLSRFDLPRIPVDEGDLTTGGIIALVAAAIATLVAAVAGGKVGERYHRKIDRTGLRAQDGREVVAR